MTIYLGIDNTNAAGTPGTGKIALTIASALAKDFTIVGVTRHQLLVHDDIRATTHNAALAVHIAGAGMVPKEQIFALAKKFVAEMAAPGSNPGVCVASADQITAELSTFARDAQGCVLSLNEAFAVARAGGLLLEGFGSRDGIIGAVAAVGLAASGNDGYFVMKGSLRDLSGRCSIASLLAAGVDEVRGPDGVPLTDGDVIIREFPKPKLMGGRAILPVEEDAGEYRDLRVG